MLSVQGVLGLVTLHVVAAQSGLQYNHFAQNDQFGLPVGSGSGTVFIPGSNQGGVSGSSGQFGVSGLPVGSGSGTVFIPGSNQGGVSGSSGQFGVSFIPGGLSDDGSSSGVSAGVPGGAGGQVVQGFNTLPTFAGIPAQGGQGVFSQPSNGPAFIGGPVVPVPSRAPVFTAQSGVISLPSQQGPAFIGGQGGSFIGRPVSGQAGVFGGSFQQGGIQAGGVQAAGFRFPSRVIQEEATPTVTRTVTIDAFETLTDLVLHSVAVTRTQFNLVTTTRLTRVVVPTPINHGLALTTSVVVSPAYVTVTETKSDFRVVLRTSVSYVTLTHTSYAIMHVPFTLYVTETVEVTSPVVRTVINTSVEAVTNYHTVTSTAYVHGGYH